MKFELVYKAYHTSLISLTRSSVHTSVPSSCKNMTPGNIRKEYMSTRQRFDIGTCNESATESAVKVTILPKQKKETTIIHAKISDKVRAQTKVQF